MKKKIISFKCHRCGAFIFTDKEKARCETCGSDYILRDGKFYRENVYSKMYKSKG